MDNLPDNLDPTSTTIPSATTTPSNIAKSLQGVTGSANVSPNYSPGLLGFSPAVLAAHAAAPSNVKPAAMETPASEAQSSVAGLTYGQETSPTAGLAQQLYTQLQSLSPAQAQQVIASIPSTSTLGQQLAQLSNPTASSASNYGFDPLSLGNLFSTSLAPWLSQQQAANTSAQSGLTANLTAALKGAPASVQAAYSALIPSQAAAQNTTNEAMSQSIATAPEWDALISGLTNATNQARLTQAAAQEEPYIAASTGIGTAPTTGASQAANLALNQIIQRASLPGAQSAPVTG